MEPKIENSLNMAVEDVDDLEWEVRNENTPVSIHMMGILYFFYKLKKS